MPNETTESNNTLAGPTVFRAPSTPPSMLATKGCATLFFTLSAADNHWEDLHRLMPPHHEDSAAGRRAAVIANPHIFDSYFGTIYMVKLFIAPSSTTTRCQMEVV